MAEMVKLPGIGSVKKNTALIGGAAAVALIAAMYIRRRNSGNTSSPVSTDIDPVTGYPYGSPQDVAALALQATGSSTVTGSGGGSGTSDTSTDTSTDTGLPTFHSNAEWAQYVQQYMVNNQGADPAVIGGLIGKYLTGQEIPTAQRQVIDTAVGIANYPPISGAGGFPPSIHLTPASPTPTQNLGTTHLTIRPHVKTKNTNVIQWTAVAHATNTEIFRDNKLLATIPTTQSLALTVNLGHTYAVRATAPNYNPSPMSNAVRV